MALITVPDDTFAQSRYNFNSRVFPEDLGMDYYGHYILININVPVFPGGASRSAFNWRTDLLGGDFSKVDILRFGTGAGANYFGGQLSEGFTLPRATRRIAESIALAIPAPIVFNDTNRYEGISLTALAGTLGTGMIPVFGALVGGLMGGPGGAVAGGTFASWFANFLSANGETISTVSRAVGYPINPRIEVLFSTRDQRQFRFEILMAPKSEAESLAMEEIIKVLRFHAAPELDPLTGGFTFIPPAEFDITFMNKGVENIHIPRINTCVLENIEVNYTPGNGIFSTFTNGYPVACLMTLGFREIEIIHKLRVLQGF